MMIYRLEQRTWNDGRMSDFDLPRTLGHYSTRELAETDRDRHIVAITAKQDDDTYTTAEDYEIVEVYVRTK